MTFFFFFLTILLHSAFGIFESECGCHLVVSDTRMSQYTTYFASFYVTKNTHCY